MANPIIKHIKIGSNIYDIYSGESSDVTENLKSKQDSELIFGVYGDVNGSPIQTIAGSLSSDTSDDGETETTFGTGTELKNVSENSYYSPTSIYTYTDFTYAYLPGYTTAMTTIDSLRSTLKKCSEYLDDLHKKSAFINATLFIDHTTISASIGSITSDSSSETTEPRDICIPLILQGSISSTGILPDDMMTNINSGTTMYVGYQTFQFYGVTYTVRAEIPISPNAISTYGGDTDNGNIRCNLFWSVGMTSTAVKKLIDTYAPVPTVVSNNPTLDYAVKSTIGSVNGTEFTITGPTDYLAACTYEKTGAFSNTSSSWSTLTTITTASHPSILTVGFYETSSKNGAVLVSNSSSSKSYTDSNVLGFCGYFYYSSGWGGGSGNQPYGSLTVCVPKNTTVYVRGVYCSNVYVTQAFLGGED